MDDFVIARNPDPASALPYLLRLPLPRPVVLKARETWPRTAKVYCHRAEGWHPGETVLDLGSGAGADVLISARRVAPGGRAIGVDSCPTA